MKLKLKLFLVLFAAALIPMIVAAMICGGDMGMESLIPGLAGAALGLVLLGLVLLGWILGRMVDRAVAEAGEKHPQKLMDQDTCQGETAQGERAEKLLKEMALQLKKSAEDFEQFAYVASHDLQEPLRMVTSYTQLLENKYGPVLDDRAKKYLFYARDGAERMQGLILDLLAYSRLHTHGADFRSAGLDDCLGRAIRSLGKQIDEKKAVVTTRTLPCLPCDEKQICLVFWHLMDNSLKFSNTDRPRIRIGAKEESETWTIWVSDNGIGIPGEHKEKIFVIFKRLHTRNEYPGTGVGLAMCKRIIVSGLIPGWTKDRHFIFPCPKNRWR